jgi:hypothetical protein
MLEMSNYLPSLVGKWLHAILTCIARPGLPKRFQSFLFFRIRNKTDFKSRLKTFIPKITTAQDACGMSDKIQAARKQAKLAGSKTQIEPLPGINISFTSTGLEAVSHPVRIDEILMD